MILVVHNGNLSLEIDEGVGGLVRVLSGVFWRPENCHTTVQVVKEGENNEPDELGIVSNLACCPQAVK